MIKFFRSFFVVFIFGLFGLGALFLRYCIFPFQKDKNSSYKSLQKTWNFLIYIIQKTGIINIKTDDFEKIKNIKNSIIVSTHPSFIDIVILMSIIPNSTCFVAEKLAHNPFLKGIVKYLFIIEGQSQEKWLSESCQKLHEGFNVIIFPMGRRHKRNETPRIRRGAALLAQKSKKNIVLLNIETSCDFLQGNQPIYDTGDKSVVYTLEYIGQIDTNDYLNKFLDEVTFKTEITKQLTKFLYKK